jgi:hypothetical protein
MFYQTSTKLQVIINWLILSDMFFNIGKNLRCYTVMVYGSGEN